MVTALVAHRPEIEEVQAAVQLALAIEVPRPLLQAQGNFLLNRFAKELDLGVLKHNARKSLAAALGAVASVQPQAAGRVAQQGHSMQPRQMQTQGCLAGSRRADDSHAFSRLDLQGDVFQQRRVRAGRLKAQLFGADQTSHPHHARDLQVPNACPYQQRQTSRRRIQDY